MNSLVGLTLIYGFMSLGSASILYLSFKGQVDKSGRLFLLAEFMVIPMVTLIAITNLIPGTAQPTLLFTTNLLVFTVDITIIFSIYALEHDIQIKKYLLAILGAAIYCGIMELCRRITDHNLPLLLISIGNALLALGAYLACESRLDIGLRTNQFLVWLKNLEIGLGLYQLLRVAGYFTNENITPRNPTAITTVLYAIFITLSIFRYIAYQSLRISWIDPRTHDANRLNVNLANLSKEKEKLIQSLISSNRALGMSALANSLAHQISQPLTSIAIQADIIKRDLTESNSHQNTLESINNMTFQLENLAGLVKTFRQLFILGDCQFSEINLQKITDDILEIIEPTLISKNIQLEKIYASDAAVWGNAIQIQQVLINLFNNAMDAIDDANSVPRKIELSFSKKGRFAIIGIKDNGTGIDAELLPTLFDLYKTSKHEGLGVGLWLCKTIINKHCGVILATNNPEKGALFEIQIPLI